MAELTATAVAMINSSVRDVRGALVDYESVRPLLLPDNFDEYRVLAGGRGAGTEVSWTLLVGDPRPRRRWQLGRPKREPWDCLVHVDEAGDDQIVERDTRTALVTTWTVHEAGEGRTAVRVLASWPGPDGLTRLLTRSRQQLALRTIYEDILTRLHEHFEPARSGKAGQDEAEPQDTKARETEARETDGEEPDTDATEVKDSTHASGSPETPESSATPETPETPDKAARERPEHG
jgi:hypothetical protein